MSNENPNQDLFPDHYIVQIKECPKDASSREQSIVRSLAATYARRDLLELAFRRYEESREQGFHRFGGDAVTDEEIQDALNRAEETTRLFAPGYRVRVEAGPLLKDRSRQP